MLILAIETATLWESIALTEDYEVRAELTLQVPVSHSSALMDGIDFLCRSLNTPIRTLGLIAVSAGPGSFTGLRIGIATAQALAFALSRPVIGVATLHGLALDARPMATEGDYLLPLLDARRSEFYGGLFQIREGVLQRVRSDRVAPLTDFLRPQSGTVIFCGPGLDKARSVIEQSYSGAHLVYDQGGTIPQARHIAQLAFDLYSEGESVRDIAVSPIYLRSPDIR